MPTLTLTLAASADDAIINDSAYDDTATTMNVGGVGSSPNANYGQGWRFDNVTLDSTHRITGVRLRLMKSTTQFSTQVNRWTFEDADDAATFSSGSPPGARSIVASPVAESVNVNETDGTVYDFPRAATDQALLAARLQSVINRGGWASGNAVALINNSDQDASASVSFSRKLFHTYDSGTGSSEPQLVIDYLDPLDGAGTYGDLQILTQPGATGNITYPLANNFDPKAIILWGVPLAADGTGADAILGWGFGTYRGSTVQERYATFAMDDASSTMVCVRGSGSDALFVLQAPTSPTRDLEIDLVSLGTGSTSEVVLNWANLHTTASIRIFMLVLGGDDITDALVDDFTIGTGSATQDETVVSSFGKPELLFFMGTGPASDSSASPMSFFGFGKQGEAGRGVAHSVVRANTNSLAAMRQRSDRCVMSLLATGASAATDRAIGQLDTTVGNWPTDGFRMVWDATPSGADVVNYLALRTAGQIATGSNTAVTAGSPPVAQDNDAGFAPSAALVFGWNLAASTAQALTGADLGGFGLGAFDGTDQAWAGITDDDALGTMDDNRQQDDGYILKNYSAANAVRSSATASWSGNNLRLSWDDIDSVAREYQWLVLGSSVSGVSVTPAAASAVAGKVDPTVVLGSLVATPNAASAVAAVVAPTVINSVLLVPTAAAAVAGKADPGVILGSLAIAPNAAAAVAAVAAPALVLGSTIATPAAASAVAGIVAPTVVLGSLLLSPNAAFAVAGVVAPTVDIGSNGVVVAPAAASAVAGIVAPTVVLGSLSLAPNAASAVAGKVDPGVVLGALTLIPAAAAAVAGRVNPTVILGSLVLLPTPAGVVAVVVAPAVILGSLAIAPTPAAAIAATFGPDTILIVTPTAYIRARPGGAPAALSHPGGASPASARPGGQAGGWARPGGRRG